MNATDSPGGGVFGLSVEHLLILLVAALFILGPERLPEAAHWLAQTVRKPLEDLRALRDPKAALGRYLTTDADDRRRRPDRSGPEWTVAAAVDGATPRSRR